MRGEPRRADRRGTEQLANIAAAAMDAIISVDERQRIILFNPAAESMFGFAAGEAIGQPLDILIPQRFRKAHAEHVLHFMKEGATARRMGSLGRLTGVRANGEEFPIEASISRVSNAGGWLHTAIVRDVTEHVQTERQLRSFIDSAPAAIAMFDRNMRYLAASRRWMEDYGLSGSVIGRSHFEVFPDNPAHWKQAYRRVLAGETMKAEETFLHRANAPSLWLKWEMRPWYLAQGAIGGLVLFTEDITERKRHPQGRNPREAGHPELHDAMRISPPPSACERLTARPERLAGLRGNVLRQLR